MTVLKFIYSSSKLLFSYKPGKLILVFLLTLLLGINSGFSIVLLIPLLQLLNVGAGQAPGGIALFIRETAEGMGINLTIESILITYVILLTLGALLQYWKTLVDADYQMNFIYRLRSRLFRKVISADWHLLSSKSRTSHMQVLTREVPNTAYYYVYYLKLITSLLIILAYVAWAMVVSVKFTLIIITAGAILFLLLRQFLLKAFNLGSSFLESYNRLYKYIDDFWQTIKIAKVHSSEEFYYSKFDEASNSLLYMEFRMQKNWSVPQLIYRITGIIILVAVVWLGYRSGQTELASFFILILLFSRIFPQFVSVNSDLNVLFANAPSVRLVMQFDEEFAGEEISETTEPEASVPAGDIKLENISFAYPDGEVVFSGFSETIPVLAITGVTGESGRGKTTLIDLIAGLQKPGSGVITIGGIALDERLLPAWRTRIGYLPQDPFFIDGTIRENLVWDSGPGISDSDILEVLAAVNGSHLVERYEKELDAYIVNYQYTFSGGECQKLALARVLLRKPSLLLLDEATSSLDTENEAVIMEVISKLKAKMTIVFVTHRTSVHRFFDRVIRL
jgi:ATP-binding cassette subfamily C protein